MTLLDSSAIIDLARQEKWILDALSRLQDRVLGISVITIAEVKIGLHLTKNKQEAVVSTLQNLINNSVLEVIDVDSEIADQIATVQNDLRLKGSMLAPFDSIIAATALVKKAILATNDSDFKRVKGLKLITPRQAKFPSGT